MGISLALSKPISRKGKAKVTQRNQTLYCRCESNPKFTHASSTYVEQNIEYQATGDHILLTRSVGLLTSMILGVTTVVNGLRESVAELRVILKLMFLRPMVSSSIIMTYQEDLTLKKVLPKFKSSTPDYLLFTKPFVDAPKSVTDDIKKYVDVVYVYGFTMDIFSMMPDFYSDPYT
uniref:Uncharacterized protein n=1 Tax=Tanacetum cinerariifolium TaxID=118510 RepID=A0A699IPN3_TANCI|nr:hypothetical protein [Tanacetum cinerariifolium]